MILQSRATHALIQQQLLAIPPASRPAALSALQLQVQRSLALYSRQAIGGMLDADQQRALSKGRVVLTDDDRTSYGQLTGTDMVLRVGETEAGADLEEDIDLFDAGDIVELLLVLTGAIAAPIFLLIRWLGHDVDLLDATVRGMHANEFNQDVPRMRTRLMRPLGLALHELSAQMQALLDGQRLMSQAVAHEMRTPLARLRFTTGYLEEQDDLDPATHALVQDLRADLETLEALTNAGVEYMRFGRMPIVERDQVDVESLMRAVLHVIEGRADIAFSLHHAPLPPINANAAALELALRNLVGNACTHARSRIEITIDRVDEAIRFRIDDDGEGIAVEDRQRVFEPYVRLGRNAGGFGLGLAMARAIAERHGGSLEALQSPLGGARLELLIHQADLAT
ncbi:ATP-binding protein [Stenotrophomonas sp. C3(2023)]|uniref:ATP-binding protein n=1 Tax=Stenotrophomonas sp. C3(2023) TaxID=3080277 RepID=UPI00293CE07C|nr:ATP-binding protein [Stenotrophomonas sp. C3(2023)]MDV3467673.1 ATP-binding protein [Stenotrophomonas sp. C3(2023)]